MSKVSPGKLYIGQLIRVVNLVQQHGKRVMFWADTVNIFRQVPRNLSPSFPEESSPCPGWISSRRITRPGLRPGRPTTSRPSSPPIFTTACRFSPSTITALTLLTVLLETGRKYGIIGQLINLWTDTNQDLYRMAWPGMAYGAAAAWQQGPVARERFFPITRPSSTRPP